MFQRLFSILLLLVGILLLPACTGLPVMGNTDCYPDMCFPANPLDHPIRITEKDFPEPYIVIGEVTSKGYDDRMADVAGKEELSRRARAIGGDGIIHLSRKYIEKREWGNAPESIIGVGMRDQDRVVLNGFVIRFKDEAK